MSIRSGEFAQQLPDDQHEKEKVRRPHPFVVDEEKDGQNGDDGIGREQGEDELLVLDLDEEEGATANIDDTPSDVYAPPVGMRPRHYPPHPSSAQAPKPLSKSPVAMDMDELKDRLNKKSPLSAFLSSSSSTSSPPRSGKVPGPAPTISSSDGTSSSNKEHGFHKEETIHHQTPPTSSASLVVCGVDGTVYTLDAYSGQLRGMFAAGGDLVFSSSPDEQKKDADKGNESTGDEQNSMYEHLDGDESNAVTASVVPPSSSWKERVVPGLDGRLYSLFEIVDDTNTEVLDDTDFEHCQGAEDYENDDDLDDICKTRIPEPTSLGGSSSDSNVDGSSSSSGVIPRVGTYSLTPLPISAIDVVDSPISTCRPTNGDSEQQQCGIIMGSKKTTIYAIDPITGKVQWTQDPLGGGGGRGFTKTRPAKYTASRVHTVLLQREDYAVRQLDTDGGEEVWKVKLGRFSALDFDGGSSSQSGSGQDTSFEDVGSESPTATGGGDPVVGGRAKRGAAAAAASVESKDKKKGIVPPILGGRKKTSLNDFDSGFGDDHKHHQDGAGRKENLFDHQEDDHFDHDRHSRSRGFPSIAFGEDGTSIMALDGISGELLWKRRIESVVAAVYGVGKETSWIPLDVIDASDVFTHGLGQRASGFLPSSSFPTSSPHSGCLVPYGAGQMESGEVHRLGRHHKNIFVSSKFDASSGYNPLPEPEDNFPYDVNLDTPLPPQMSGNVHEFYPIGDRIFTISPSQATLGEEKRPPSHRTEHGLYLTWSMLAAIGMIALSFVVFVARIVMLRQKRKWENTPSLDPTTAPSSSEDGNRERSSSGGMLLPPTAAQSLPASSSGNIWLKKQHNPAVARSFSVGALGSHSMGSPRSNIVAQPFLSEKNGASIPLLDISAAKPTAAATAAIPSSPTIARSMTLPTEASPTTDNSNQRRPRLPSVDNIDGIPLVRYSRYRSEFEEKSALGSGGFGTVFQCKNTLDGREYAIKKIKILSQLSVDGTVTKHFSQKLHRVLREVKILALLDHPNIVRYYTAWLEADDGTQNEDDETNITTSSMFDTRKSQSIFSSSIFSGFGSNSRAASQTFLCPKRSIHQQQKSKGGFLGSYNPLGWNNFGSSFRLDESQSEASSSFETQQENGAQRFAASGEDDEDLGFTWERSSENTTLEPSMNNAGKQTLRILNEDTMEEDDDSQSSSGISSVDSEDSKSQLPKAVASKPATQSTKNDAKKSVRLSEPTKDERDRKQKTITTEEKHMLFIQMQLCSIQTLADFLADRHARSGLSQSASSQNRKYAVDIPYALRLFAQIANGVKYVHKQGLIHRDLKPQNCFIDEAGNVKVGDFGLSRSNASSITDIDENGKDMVDDSTQHDDSFGPPDNSFDAENTAGVGTRTYASPEQMRGSNYDASTDIYSLGLILFELCSPPMVTAMERYKKFDGIKKGNFTTNWNSHVKASFPTMHDLLVRMISDSTGQRPSADVVSDHIDSLLQEYSVQSLDKTWGKKGALLLRVEGEEKEGVLTNAMKIIKDTAPNATILQYGLRGQSSKAIMEFALEVKEDEKDASVECIRAGLQCYAMTVRRISNS